MENKQYGYVRVSTREQNEDRQIRAMEDFGIQPANLICDRQSGKDFERPGYRRLLRKIKPGDTLVIKSIDRLGISHTGFRKWVLRDMADDGSAEIV